MRTAVFKPTRDELLAARTKTVPDLIAPRLKCLFVGVNPGLYTAAIGHHFGRPGNRFWPALYAGGFSRRLLSPFEEAELLQDGYGITNIVGRATVAEEELTNEELRQGGTIVLAKVKKHKPRWVAVLGIGAYRAAFQDSRARLGPQEKNIAGARLWLLPNPSGLNAHYQAKDLARLFSALWRAVQKDQIS